MRCLENRLLAKFALVFFGSGTNRWLEMIDFVVIVAATSVQVTVLELDGVWFSGHC